MLFSDANGHSVVSTATAGIVGKVHGFVVDPSSRQVVALELKKTDTGDTLAWADLTAFGADAVTVGDTEVIREADGDIAELTGKDHRLVGKRALSDGGDELGKVKDVAFDPATGAVTGIVVGKEELAGERLIGVGSYAVVIRAA